MAAVLACGPAALLSHQSGAAHWELLASARSRIDVIAPRSRTVRPGIAVHRIRHMHPADRALKDGIPVTTVARTLLDLAAAIPLRQLKRALEQAERLRLFDLKAIERLLSRSRGHRGRSALVALLGAYSGPPPATRSELERRFLDICSDAGLPRPLVNVFIAGFEVDAVWPDRRLVVELDGYRFHHTREAFERDRL